MTDLQYDEATLIENERKLTTELTAKIRVYENRYELKSERLMEALNSGRLHETHEVCQWVIEWGMLERIRSYRQGEES